MSDWFVDNEDKRVVRLITRELPGAARSPARQLNERGIPSL